MAIIVLAKYLDGKMVRGQSIDLSSSKSSFHLATDTGEMLKIPIVSLKAVFYLREGGDSPKEARARYGKKLLIRFVDGEEILGVSADYRKDKERFFLFPLDNDDNNERILVNNKAVQKVQTLGVTYGLDVAPVKIKDRSRKNLEHEIYKLLFSVASDIQQPDRLEDPAHLKGINVLLKNRMSPVLQEYERLYSEHDCKNCLEAKLKEIQFQMGDQVYDALKGIVARIG